MTVEMVQTRILQVLAVGGTSRALAYGLFKWLGQKWI